MGEMIERVARALFEKGPSHTRPAPGWEYLTEDWKEAFRSTARVAMEAMREPIETMVNAADNSFEWGPPMAGPLNDALPGPVWRAMIDAALKEDIPLGMPGNPVIGQPLPDLPPGMVWWDLGRWIDLRSEPDKPDDDHD
jgi:hypothetical protein